MNDGMTQYIIVETPCYVPVYVPVYVPCWGTISPDAGGSEPAAGDERDSAWLPVHADRGTSGSAVISVLAEEDKSGSLLEADTLLSVQADDDECGNSHAAGAVLSAHAEGDVSGIQRILMAFLVGRGD